MPPTRRDFTVLTGALMTDALLSGCLGGGAGNDTNDSVPADDTTGPGTDPVTTRSPTSTPSKQERNARERVIRANTDFAFDLLSRLDGSKNLFFSPYSISVALAMTEAGASGETREQMAKALHFESNATDVGAAFRAIRQGLAQNATRENDDTTPFRLTEANELWGQQGYPWSDSYLDSLETNYSATFDAVDFERPDAVRNRINDWVDDETNGKITELVGPGTLTPLTRLVLTNAMYFRANWKSTFDEKRTRHAEFTALDGSTSTVPMMKQEDWFRYATVDGHQLVFLPYAGGDVSIVVFLPAKGQFENFRSSLDADRLDTFLNALDDHEGTVRLPRFTSRTRLNLNDVLETLGMTDAFDSQRADFSGMVDGNDNPDLSIGTVLHEGYIDVDEQGTEAAAATAVTVVATGARVSHDPFEMIVDRPFCYLIRGQESGTVLFLGQVTDAGDVA